VTFCTSCTSRAALLLGWVACMLVVAPLAAEPEGRAIAQASCARGEQAARDLRFADALAAYRAALVADPSAPCVSAARARVEDLEAHAEGDFAPLAVVEAARRDPQRLADRAALEAFEQAVAAFPAGRVRAEGNLVAAHAWQRGVKVPERAIAAFQAVIRDPAGDRLTRAVALAELWALRKQRGEFHEAAPDVERDPDLSPAVTKSVRRAVARSRMSAAATAALGVLGGVFALSIAALVRKSRDVREVPGRLVRPFEVAFALYVGGASAVLVRVHGDGDTRPFLLFGAGVLALVAGARAFALAFAARSRLVRAAWALACATGVVAAAFLALERTDPSYLEGLGL
jgi:hypothetical protein